MVSGVDGAVSSAADLTLVGNGDGECGQPPNCDGGVVDSVLPKASRGSCSPAAAVDIGGTKDTMKAAVELNKNVRRIALSSVVAPSAV